MIEYIIFLITQFLLLLPFALLVFYVIEKFVAMPKYSKYAKIIPIFIVHYIFACIIFLILMSIISVGYSFLNIIGVLLFVLILVFIMKYFNLSKKLENIIIFSIAILVSGVKFFYNYLSISEFFNILIVNYLTLLIFYYFVYHFISIVIYFIISFYVVLKRAIFYGGLFIIYKFQEAMLYSILLLLGVFTGGAIAIFAFAAVAMHLPYIILGIIVLIYLSSLYFYIKEELDILKEKKNAKLNKYQFEREV